MYVVIFITKVNIVFFGKYLGSIWWSLRNVAKNIVKIIREKIRFTDFNTIFLFLQFYV